MNAEIVLSGLRGILSDGQIMMLPQTDIKNMQKPEKFWMCRPQSPSYIRIL